MKIYIVERNFHYPVESLGYPQTQSEDIAWFSQESDCKTYMDRKNRNNRDGYTHYAMREEDLQ